MVNKSETFRPHFLSVHVSQVNKTQSRKNELPGSMFIFNIPVSESFTSAADFTERQSHHELGLASKHRCTATQTAALERLSGTGNAYLYYPLILLSWTALLPSCECPWAIQLPWERFIFLRYAGKLVSKCSCAVQMASGRARIVGFLSVLTHKLM